MGEEIIGAGEANDPRALKLATRIGRSIPNVCESPLSPAEMKALVRGQLRSHPYAVLRSAASVYNCMGLLFASRRTAIDVELVPRILCEDAYRQIPYDEVQMGDIVVYRDRLDRISHVGSIAFLPLEQQGDLNSARILSQWGFAGEYLHAPLDVPPLYGKPSEFWTDRVSVS